MFVNKILASDLKHAILDMNDLLGISVAELLLQYLKNRGILADGEDDYRSYTFDELNDIMTVIFGEATPLFMLQLEKHFQYKKD